MSALPATTCHGLPTASSRSMEAASDMLLATADFAASSAAARFIKTMAVSSPRAKRPRKQLQRVIGECSLVREDGNGERLAERLAGNLVRGLQVNSELAGPVQ